MRIIKRKKANILFKEVLLKQNNTINQKKLSKFNNGALLLIKEKNVITEYIAMIKHFTNFHSNS